MGFLAAENSAFFGRFKNERFWNGRRLCETIGDEFRFHPVGLRLDMASPNKFSNSFRHVSLNECPGNSSHKALLVVEVQCVSNIVKKPRMILATIEGLDWPNAEFIKARQCIIPRLNRIAYD